MRSLFLKIFLSYWVALALFFVLAIIVTITLRQRGELAAWEARQNAVLSEAVQTYEQAGQPELRRYLDDPHDSQHVRAFLFDDHGQELSGRPVPHWAESVARGAMPPPHDLWQRFAPSPFRRITLAASSGRHYTAVVMLPPRSDRPRRHTGHGSFYRNCLLRLGVLLARPLFDLAHSPPTRRYPEIGRRRPKRSRW